MLNHKRGYPNPYIQGEKCNWILLCSVPMLEGGHVTVRRITLKKTVKKHIKDRKTGGLFPPM